MKKTYVIVAAFCLSIGLSSAQTAEKKWGIGLLDGGNSYIGNQGNVINPRGQYFMGLSLTRYLSPSFDLGVQATYGDESKIIGRVKKDGYLLLHYKLNNGYILSDSCKLSPYIAIGQGVVKYQTGNDFILPIGIGIKYQISKKVAIQYQGLFFLTNNDARDGKVNANPAWNKNDKYLENSLGIIFNFDCLALNLDKCSR